MPGTLTDTINYSGMLHSKVDEKTRFLDAVYARGKNGGTIESYSTKFVLSSGYDMDDPEQPEISENDSLTAPDPETTERDQEFNVCQIFQKAVSVSYMKQSNRDALGGVNKANQSNNVTNELDFQIGRRIAQSRMDLNYTMLNGVYQYTEGSTTVAPMTRGVLSAITTNLFDAAGAALTKKIINNAVKEAIANGADPTQLEIWVNPIMLDIITDTYALIPGSTLPSTRTEGGIAYTQILTPYAPLDIHWDSNIAAGNIGMINIGGVAVAEKPYFNENGEFIGTMFYERLAKTGAAESGQIYGELGCDYGAEWLHVLIKNIATT